ncbi:MAG: DegT/DnrJ/EryC1/StrS family aminotransferase [Candidatus Marinimicrobia bacterium]|nr:DegT/DnrJ/EryC1/StrS family aminotransferase [Candidatus Neomarinimicrobiota bacterium]
MKVPFLDLSITSKEERAELLNAVETVLKHGRLVLGPEVEEFETRFAKQCGRKFAVGVSSGTDALYLGLRSLGIGAGDEVITPSLSWIATANAIALTGATPLFADIADDQNISPESARRLISDKTKALLPVHFNGKVCRMDELSEIAREHDLLMIEDAAQSFSARYDNKLAGSFGNIACFSLNPMKIFAAVGEAGVIITDDPEIRKRLISLRYAGTIDREVCVEPAFNSRLDTIQAAMLLVRFNKVESIVERRREIAGLYSALIGDIVITPEDADGERHVYYTYTIRCENRDELKRHLESKGIEVKIRHPLLMPLQPAYKDKSRAEFSNAEKIIGEILSLPASEAVSNEEIEYVASSIIEFYKA